MRGVKETVYGGYVSSRGPEVPVQGPFKEICWTGGSGKAYYYFGVRRYCCFSGYGVYVVREWWMCVVISSCGCD